MENEKIAEILNKLTPKEKKFVTALRSCGKQGEAARVAGYSEKSADVQASRLMQREDIQAALFELYKLDCKALCISSDSIIVKASQIYNRCMQAEPVMEFDRGTGEYREVGRYTFDSKGAAKALDVIVKVAGLDKKKIEVEQQKPFDVNITVVE